jgi:hypothetical protein
MTNPSRRAILQMGGGGAMAAGLSGCELIPRRRWSYRYKLTLTLDTPDGVRRGSSVVELQAVEVPMVKVIASEIRGEATFVDLGSGKRPLIALLTNYFAETSRPHWSRDKGPNLGFLLDLFDVKADLGHKDSILDAIDKIRESRTIQPSDLPDLVTFADVLDPKSVLLVDPMNLEATLGPGIKWRSIELGLVDEAPTNLIEAKLPWLGDYFDRMLDGKKFSLASEESVASHMTPSSFRWKMNR